VNSNQSTNDKKITNTIKPQSFRMTRQRRVILDELRKVKTHPCADELYENVRKVLPRISMGTVYRNLEILTRQNEILTLNIPGSLKRYDGNPHPHYHIRCLECGCIDDAPMEVLNLDQYSKSFSNFEIKGHHIEFTGVCQTCVKDELSSEY
jgi:Fur family transcriptional regulator, peroxide stress response regulator